MVLRLLRVAGGDVVLVGGQALVFWAFFHGVILPPGVPTISNDSDFLVDSASDRETVAAFAAALRGKAIYPGRAELTALVGQAELVLSDEEAIHVDVIFRIVGLSADAVRARAVRAELSGVSFRVMHPLHVLHSRLANLHELREKQNEKGAMQLRVAIEVARAFLRDEAASLTDEELTVGRSKLQVHVSEIEKLAIDDAGRKVAARWGIHVADAIDPSRIPAGLFWTRKWPSLKRLMSPGHAARFAPPKARR